MTILDSLIRVSLEDRDYIVRVRGSDVLVQYYAYYAGKGASGRRKLWQGVPSVAMNSLAARVLAEIKTEVLKW